MATYVKVPPPPSQLTQNETLESLDHWKSIFRNYFRCDSIFKQFLKFVISGFSHSYFAETPFEYIIENLKANPT